MHRGALVKRGVPTIPHADRVRLCFSEKLGFRTNDLRERSASVYGKPAVNGQPFSYPLISLPVLLELLAESVRDNRR